METKEREKINILLWLDDIRDPYQSTWIEDYAPDYIGMEMNIIWVKSYYEFTSWINKNGLPAMVCFDHDLGEDVAIDLVKKGVLKRKAREFKRLEKTGYDCAKWLVELCMDKDIDFPKYEVQSANIVGKENIISLINNFKKHRGQE